MTISSENAGTAKRTPGQLSALLDIPQPARVGNVNPATLIRIGILAALFIVLHLRQIDVLIRSWLQNPNWSHGFLIPVFSLYLIYVRRHDIQAIPARAYWPGLAIMLFALLVEFAATLIPPLRSNFTIGQAMVLMLFGLVLYLAGPSLMRVLWLPILYLSLAIPMPEGLYVRVAYPLQELAAHGATIILRGLGVEIIRDASNLTLYSRNGIPHNLTVAEACSGMRLLMAFFALGVATAYLELRPVWQRTVLVMAALPIAVLCNVIRVALTCTMYYIDEPELGQDVLHTFTGMLMLIPAFGMLYGLGWILNRLVVEEDADDAEEETANE